MSFEKTDFHVHVTHPEVIANREKIAEREPYFALLSKSPKNKFASIEDIIGMIDENSFGRAVIFGFGFNDLGLCSLTNDYVIEAAQKYPGKITGFISIPPKAKGMEKEIIRCHDAGLKGIGEIFPEGQKIDIDNESETKKLTGLCIERNLPLLFHANEPVGHYYAGKSTVSLKQIDAFIGNSQNLKVILAHWGGGLLFYEAMPEIREKYKNVFYDTAASPFLYDETIYQTAISLGLEDKIIFGSDFPLLSPPRYAPALKNIPFDIQEKILGLNAERLLLLTP